MQSAHKRTKTAIYRDATPEDITGHSPMRRILTLTLTTPVWHFTNAFVIKQALLGSDAAFRRTGLVVKVVAFHTDIRGSVVVLLSAKLVKLF